MPSLTVHRVRDDLDGEVPEVFDEVVDPEVLDSCQVHDYTTNILTARLYIPQAHPRLPRWTSFVMQGFEDARIGQGVANKALIVASIRWHRRDRLFALCFGHSRFLIRGELIEPGFGRRVALNLLYEDAGTSSDTRGRIRQVDARTIEANVRRARVQRSRDTDFETFGVDPQRDLLDQIVGVPADLDHFGSRIAGSDAVQVNPEIDFAGLGPLLKRLLTVHSRRTYREHFSWVDRVAPVGDPVLLDRLQECTTRLVSEQSGDIDLAPPELVDWDDISTFAFEVGDRPERDDLRIEGYLDALSASRVQILTYRKLVGHRVAARDGDGAVVRRWPIARCLFGELELDGKHYVLDGGHFFEIARDYLEELNEFVDAIPAPVTRLPSTMTTTSEGAYNEAVASGSANRLLLDKRTIRPAARTTAIEICDVMTTQGELIHVKRKLGSSDLSHLFGQGFVSAETMHAGPVLRAGVRDKVLEEAREQSKDHQAFCRFLDEPFRAEDLTVVYAIAATWQGSAPHHKLPFFSKVNLRHHTEQIRRMGYRVALAPVDAT